jgi:hypothetical protein
MTTARHTALALFFVIMAGCSGEATTQQLQMSGSDPDYPHAGLMSGEDGRGLIYSSDWKRVKASEMSPTDVAATADMSEKEKQQYFEWKAEKEQTEFEAWKKAQDEKAGARAN